MSGPHINELAPNRHGHQPHEMAVGVLTDEATVESVTQSLGQSGIEAERLYFISGPEVLESINDQQGFFGKLFNQDREKPMEALRAGRTLVGVVGVSGDEIDDVRAKLVDAGVLNRLYFGKWTVQ